MLLAALLDGLLGALSRLLRDLLATLERLLSGLLHLVDDAVGDLAQLLVLDARGGNQHAGEEADRDGADGEADRVLLRHALGLARLVLDLTGARGLVAHRAGDRVTRADDLVLHPHDALLGRFLLL